MCGGIAYKTKNISDEELGKYYSPQIIKRFKNSGRAESFFWHNRAVLPIKTKSGIQLKLWGNKDKNLKLPPTGWARKESLSSGKWDYLRPEPVDIPADLGYEKKTWFSFKNGTKGVIVKKGGEERVYMITEEAGAEYRHRTGHDREPVGGKGNYEHNEGKPVK